MINACIIKKISVIVLFFSFFFIFISIEYNIKDDLIMNYQISKTINSLDEYKTNKFIFADYESEELLLILRQTDSLKINLEFIWINYLINTNIKKSHSEHIQHRYVTTQKEINFIQLLISTEINKRKYEYVKTNLSKFKIN